MAIYKLSITIVDAKGKPSRTTLYNPDTNSIGTPIDIVALINAGVAMTEIIAKLAKGGVSGASLCVDLGSQIGSAQFVPDADSDVEEGALFNFRTLSNFFTRSRIPTFDEAKLVPGTDDVDLTDPDVAAYTSAMLTGVSVNDSEGNPITVNFSDSRGDDVNVMESAYESFQSSGKRR